MNSGYHVEIDAGPILPRDDNLICRIRPVEDRGMAVPSMNSNLGVEVGEVGRIHLEAASGRLGSGCCGC
jgi:hypothetical protein